MMIIISIEEMIEVGIIMIEIKGHTEMKGAEATVILKAEAGVEAEAEVEVIADHIVTAGLLIEIIKNNNKTVFLILFLNLNHL